MADSNNFNDAKIPNLDIGNYSLDEPRDHSACSTDGKVDVYFRNLKNNLIEKINDADVVFGCVSWITDLDIIRALQKKTVMLVIQKERYLKPQADEYKSSKNLREEYKKLHCSIELQSIGNQIGENMYYFFDPADPIVCVGEIKKEDGFSHPLMHNKFLVFAKWCKDIPTKTKEYAVWTGSFNFSKNASQSFENALYLIDPEIVNAYFQEFGQIWLLSEPVVWNSEEMSPFMYFDS